MPSLLLAAALVGEAFDDVEGGGASDSPDPPPSMLREALEAKAPNPPPVGLLAKAAKPAPDDGAVEVKAAGTVELPSADIAGAEDDPKADAPNEPVGVGAGLLNALVELAPVDEPKAGAVAGVENADPEPELKAPPPKALFPPMGPDPKEPKPL
jgi:hypothetical protein